VAFSAKQPGQRSANDAAMAIEIFYFTKAKAEKFLTACLCV